MESLAAAVARPFPGMLCFYAATFEGCEDEECRSRAGCAAHCRESFSECGIT